MFTRIIPGQLSTVFFVLEVESSFLQKQYYMVDVYFEITYLLILDLNYVNKLLNVN